MPTAPRVVLLDRDRVINVDRTASVLSAAEFVLIPGSLAALVALTRAGWLVAVVTNQACIGRG
jgi:D-glycero-D-manno-heptose 1,7-bisphosphate phosphatase